MNLHEYQAKQLFADYGVAVAPHRVAVSVAEAVAATGELGGERWVVKAQVHAGGRGKAGGVVIADTPSAVATAAEQLLGRRLVTAQSGPQGQPVERLLIEPASAIARELYLGMLIDRARRRVVFIGSAEGGINIEEVALLRPEAILTLPVHPVVGLQPYQGRRMGFFLGLSGEPLRQLGQLMAGLYRLFSENDATLIEINPLVVTADETLLALDGKIVLDENALPRQPALAALRDRAQEEESECRAREYDLNYVKLNGNIGCMVNGAGLAMATMDLIKLHGGEPANFLDVGGGTTAERVAAAFKLILADQGVRTILVNIFGGIVRCDLIAEGIISALRDVASEIPVVVRLEGTNAEQGRALLSASGLAVQSAADLTDAARQVVALAGNNGAK